MTKQVWKCPKCELSYDSPIRVYEVICPKSRGRGHGLKEVVLMVLVEGDPLPVRKPKIKKAVKA